jgi:hypothetical protein
LTQTRLSGDKSRGRRLNAKRRICSFALLALAAGPAASAIAQEPDLLGPLTDSVRCSGAGAQEDLQNKLMRLTASPEAVTSALKLVAADPSRCEPLRAAAAELAGTVGLAAPPSEEEVATDSARAVVAQSLAEAEANAIRLKFDVGPPPRNMTKGRTERP